MKTGLMTAALALVLAAPAVGEARPHPDEHRGKHGRDHYEAAGRGHPHGMPPGQAKKYWRQGQHMPRSYVVERTYYVSEPARYRLRTPPAGYRWVRVGDDVYLAQTETGLIADVVRSLFQ